MTGRPEKPIDWDSVDKYLLAGRSGVAISKSIGIHYTTLYDRCVKEKGCSFTEYSITLYSKGDCEIAWAHYEEGVINRNTNILSKLYDKVIADEKTMGNTDDQIVNVSEIGESQN